MELTLTSDQEALVDAFAGFLAKESPPQAVRAAEPLGFDARLWSKAVEMGVATMALPDGGAALLDLALLAELVGRHLAPIPFVEAAVAGRVLGEQRQLATIALRPAVDGVARLVPAAAVATAVIALDGNELVVVEGRPLPLAANMASAPLADCDLHAGERTVLATGAEAVARHARALDEWRALAASVLYGIAASALDIAVAYAKQREQFGKPIGAFQSIAHRLADDATAVQGLQLLSRKAAWALDDDPTEGGRLAAMAYLWGGEVANKVAGDSLHYHGGYGFMLEYDIQLHFRRAKLWSVAMGDPRAAYTRLGYQLFSGAA
ncbi:MAG: acyl-CoA dehydrogenase family protein [Acidobacteria bacterium]|nr:acyl-CoA dehydrogenase family protein [Acidobacteriota bacterium]